MLVTEFGIKMEASLKQNLNAPSGMLVMESGIASEVRAADSNAAPSNLVTESGITIDVKVGEPANAS